MSEQRIWYAIVYRKTDDLKDYYFHFLFVSTSDMWSNSSHSEAQFLAVRNLRSIWRLLYLYGDLQIVLRFHKDNCQQLTTIQRWRPFWLEYFEAVRIV